MHDPAPDDAPHTSPEVPDRSETADHEGGSETVGQVIAWYTERILAETRAAAPDTGRLARLRAERQACVSDRRELKYADPDRAAEITALYDARFRELTEEP
ncbi:hypothetical protein [Embleya sp. NBC_00896]|uniref:hypothetical protein n=1 Tax=Embleya sp. NBC_00896 TaxID=2975961 RepID=UPI002F9152C6|nr:hypothetical protein OG928_45005 [Embleya sp. NBC_00896]